MSTESKAAQELREATMHLSNDIPLRVEYVLAELAAAHADVSRLRECLTLVDKDWNQSLKEQLAAVTAENKRLSMDFERQKLISEALKGPKYE